MNREERDQAIWEAWIQGGKTLRALGEQFGLSFERVGQILRKVVRKRRLEAARALKARSSENGANRIDELDLSVRSSNCLRSANITTLGQLAQRTAPELLRYPNFGRKSLAEIEEIMTKHGLALRQ